MNAFLENPILELYADRPDARSLTRLEAWAFAGSIEYEPFRKFDNVLRKRHTYQVEQPGSIVLYEAHESGATNRIIIGACSSNEKYRVPTIRNHSKMRRFQVQGISKVEETQ